jgi:glycosyltransferase involved in cell wall biosynthesis
MTKILIITDNLRDQINGVVTTFKNLEMRAISEGYEFEYIDPSCFKNIPAPGYSEVKLSIPAKIGDKIRESNPDFIHIATEGPIGFAARCWLDMHGYRYNTSYHTKFPEFLKEIYYVPEMLTYGYLRWFHKHSGKVLTTTNTMVDELKSHGFDSDIVPWTRGVDRSIFFPTETHDDYILCVSRVSQEKNLDEFCKLPHKNKVLVGDGPYLEELKKKYPDVHYAGKKTGSELAHYYQNAKVFVFPSKADTFGIVMIEAMACGTPVAAYPVTGPVDVIEPNVTGVMDENLAAAVDSCINLDRSAVEKASYTWSWDNCWQIFKDNLVSVR